MYYLLDVYSSLCTSPLYKGLFCTLPHLYMYWPLALSKVSCSFLTWYQMLRFPSLPRTLQLRAPLLDLLAAAVVARHFPPLPLQPEAGLARCYFPRLSPLHSRFCRPSPSPRSAAAAAALKPPRLVAVAARSGCSRCP